MGTLDFRGLTGSSANQQAKPKRHDNSKTTHSDFFAAARQCRLCRR